MYHALLISGFVGEERREREKNSCWGLICCVMMTRTLPGPKVKKGMEIDSHRDGNHKVHISTSFLSS